MKKYYFPGIISLIFLFPLCYIYLTTHKAVQPKYCIALELYNDNTSFVCGSDLARCPGYDIELYDKTTHRLELSYLISISNELKNNKLSSKAILLRFSEFVTYSDLIAVLNVFQESHPDFVMDHKRNYLAVLLSGRNKTADDFYYGGFSCVPVYKKRDISLYERFNSGIKASFNNPDAGPAGIIIFSSWLLVAIANVFHLRKIRRTDKIHFQSIEQK